jgi:hypothetical protein
MSSPVAEPAAPAPEVKVEESIVADSGAPDATDGVTRATSPEAGLTKKEFDMMTGILHRIANYRDEEYALYLGSFCAVSKLTNCLVAEMFPKTFNELSTDEYFPTTLTL